MTMASPGSLSGVLPPVARSRSAIVVTVCGLAVFLVVASFRLSSYPVSLSSQGYFRPSVVVPPPPSKANHTQVFLSTSISSPDVDDGIGIKQPSSWSEEERRMEDGHGNGSKEAGIVKVMKDSEQVHPEVQHDDGSVSSRSTGVVEMDKSSTSGFENDSKEAGPETRNGKAAPLDANRAIAPEVDRGSTSSGGREEIGMTDGSVPRNSTVGMEIDKNLSSGFKNNSEQANSEIHNEEAAPSDAGTPVPSPPSDLKMKNGMAESRSCNLYQGKWIYDPAGPLYTNNTCPFITQMQNCQGNGRPDKDYENYRWKPDQCDLPRFKPRKFLELMRGKKVAFVGDSVARNQYESLLCILSQEETPRNRGNRRMQRWYFKSTSTMIIRIWSSWLVHQNTEPFQFAPQGVNKVFLDIRDETFMELLPTFDVVVLSSGHWFAKQSVYILDNNIVGGQLWWPKDAGKKMKINNMEAFGISVETAMTAIASHPNFTGLAIVRSYSPDHYEGGSWNTGGSCTGKTMPVSEVVRNEFTDVMHEKQTAGFQRALEKSGNGHSKLRLMDITKVFGYRSDGHPGPYRSLDPNKITSRGPHGEPPPQDCLHWCMPGPIDTWNEILLEVIRREFERAGD